MRCWPGALSMEAAAGTGSVLAWVVHSPHLGMHDKGQQCPCCEAG